MLFQKKIVRVLSAVILIAMLWMVFFIVQGIFARKVSHHEMYIPEYSTSVLKVENEALIRAFFEEVVLKDQLEPKYRDYLTGDDGSDASYGIDVLATVYVFTFQEKNCQLLGVLMNLSDEEQFDKTLKKESKVGVGYASKEGTGLLIFDNNSSPLKATSLNKIANKILQESSSSFDLKKLDHKQAYVTFWKDEYVLNNGTRSFRDIQLALILEQENLTVKGRADFVYAKSKAYPVLKHEDLSIQSQFVPDGINETWTTSMKRIGINFPRITYVSGNYHYIEPSPVKALKVLPHFDGIYGFEKNMQIRIPLIALAASGDIHSLDLNSFKFAGKTYFYEQIDSKTIYLGQSPYVLSDEQDNALLKIQGNMNQLLEIRNGGMLARFLSMSPEYNAAEHFLSGIESSEFSIEQNGDKTADLDGKIQFQKDRNALNETLLLVLNLGIFN